jgi:RimJ/RimL family protein N-acetyltransferase
MIHYPIRTITKGKLNLLVRPRCRDDSELIDSFFFSIPEEDLLIFKEDVTKNEPVKSWFISDTYKKDFQLVALNKNEIISKGTIHKEGVYWQNAAELKLIVKPQYRGQGIGSIMFNALLSEIFNMKINKVIVRFSSDNNSFIKILNNYGFKAETTLKSYIKIPDKNINKDMIIASYNLNDWVRRFEFYSMFRSIN